MSSNMVGDVDAKVGVYYMSNSGAPGTIADAAIALLRGEDWSPPAERKAIALDAKTHQGEAPVGAAEGNGFRVTVEMTSLLGTAGDDFNSILTSLGYRVRRTPKLATPPADVTPPVETEAQIDAAADATANDDASATVEGTLAVPAETVAEAPALESATADLGAAPPPAEAPAVAEARAVADAPADDAAPSGEDAKPAEPEFDEVWFPGGRRPDNPRHQNKRPHRADHANGSEAPAEGSRPPRRFNRDNAAPRAEGAAVKAGAPNRPRFENKRPKQFGDDKKPFEGKKFAGKRGGDREDWKEHRPREKRDVPLDPDSPWAALAALRNPKPE